MNNMNGLNGLDTNNVPYENTKATSLYINNIDGINNTVLSTLKTIATKDSKIDTDEYILALNSIKSLEHSIEKGKNISRLKIVEVLNLFEKDLNLNDNLLLRILNIYNTYIDDTNEEKDESLIGKIEEKANEIKNDIDENMKKIAALDESLSNAKKNSKTISLKDIDSLLLLIASDDRVVNMFLKNALDLYLYHLKSTNVKNVTKWMALYHYFTLKYSLGRFPENIMAVLIQINELLEVSFNISKEQVAVFSANVDLIQDEIARINTIEETFLENEFDKKQKLFRNRTERLIESEFGAWLKKQRLDLGLSLAAFESKCGVAASYIHRIEEGEKKTPTIPIARKIAEGLNIPFLTFLVKLGVIKDEDNTVNNNIVSYIANNNLVIKNKDIYINDYVINVKMKALCEKNEKFALLKEKNNFTYKELLFHIESTEEQTLLGNISGQISQIGNAGVIALLRENQVELGNLPNFYIDDFMKFYGLDESNVVQFLNDNKIVISDDNRASYLNVEKLVKINDLKGSNIKPLTEDIIEVISSGNYYLNGQTPSVDEITSLKDIMTVVKDSTWLESTKLNDMAKLSLLVDEFKEHQKNNKL